MEYEICDEERLFDDSTNPSLKEERPRPSRSAFRLRPSDRFTNQRRDQTAVPIPEEEHQLS